MMKRIRYIKHSDGGLSAMRVITSQTGVEYDVIIEPNGKTGHILDYISRDVVMSVSGSSAHKTKIALKAALESLGVVFSEETRKKRE